MLRRAAASHCVLHRSIGSGRAIVLHGRGKKMFVVCGRERRMQHAELAPR